MEDSPELSRTQGEQLTVLRIPVSIGQYHQSPLVPNQKETEKTKRSKAIPNTNPRGGRFLRTLTCYRMYPRKHSSLSSTRTQT